MKKNFVILTVLIVFGHGLPAQDAEPLNVLVFSKTAGFRHASISSGMRMLYDLSKEQKWVITATEDASLFTDELLGRFDVAVFLNPTQDVLDDAQQAAFERFIGSGKGFVGIHASADCEYDWAWYGKLNGAYFKTHPPAQKATIIIEDDGHPAMEPFKGMETYTTVDEWYTFRENPRDNVHVLASLDESTVTKAKDDNWKMGDHPVIWWQEMGQARSFYTVFGHPHGAFGDPKVVDHINIAINWAGKRL
jgi:type 1 glutamine amidotransferase